MSPESKEAVFEHLSSFGIVIDPKTVAPCSAQGLNSRVFMASSNKGEVVVHITEPLLDHIRTRVWEKIQGIANLLTDNSTIPTAEVFFAENISPNAFVLVQRKLPGTAAGKTVITEDGQILEVWEEPAEDIRTQAARMLGAIHDVSVPGFGWLKVSEGKMHGLYPSWIAFLETELSLWLRTLSLIEDQNLIRDIEKYFSDVQTQFECAQGSLVHGDLTNPSNILVENGKITGIIDFEWALAGDPAWDFIFSNEYDMDIYFNSISQPLSPEQKKKFLARIQAYRPLWFTWALHIWATHPQGGKDSNIYKILKKYLLVSLQQHHDA